MKKILIAIGIVLLFFSTANAGPVFFRGGGGGGSDDVGTVTNGKWCVGDAGGLVQCTEDAPAGAGDVTGIGDAIGHCDAGDCTAFTIGGIKLGDAGPDSDGEFGYAANKLIIYGAAFVPATDNAYALGNSTDSQRWSDIFLGDGAVINFNGGDVTLTHGANVLTVGGGDLALGANNLTMTGSLGATGARLTAGFFADLTVTNAIAGSVTGNAGTATALAANPTDCGAGEVATGIGANGNLVCTGTPSVTTLTGAVTGNASTASALFANGANCSAGSYPLGVNASGAVEDCTAAPTQASLNVDDLITLSGVAESSVNLGTFSGSTIADNQTIKAAIQALETGFEGLPGGHTQNTDTGTDKTTFLIDSDDTGVRVKHNTTGHVLEARNAADDAYAPFQASTISGTQFTSTIATGTAPFVVASTTQVSNLKAATAGVADSATAASTVVVVESTDASSSIAMFDAAGSGSAQAIKTDTGLTYNASTGVLTATGFAGPLTGAVTGNVTGDVSGTAATVTGAAQAAITSLGTLTALTVSGAIIPNAVNTIALGSTAAEWADLFLGDGAVIYGQNDQTATLTSSASTWTASALGVTGALTANGAVTIGNANGDIATIQSTMVGSGRAVTIDADGTTTPSYATATDSLFVTSHIETAGNMYASAFIGGAGTDTQRRISFTSNTSFDCTSYPDSIYFTSDAMGFCNSTAAKTPMRLEDSQTVTGLKTFENGLYVGDTDTTTVMRLYDGSTNYWTIAVPAMAGNYTLTLPADDGTANQALITDGSGNLSFSTMTATAAGASAGMVQYNATGTGGALAADAGFIFDTATDKLTLGASGGATTGSLELYYTGTTYAATITPNASMAADVTITLPASTGTLISAAGSETWTGVQTYSSASNNSSVNVLTFTGVPAQNASDVHRGVYFAPTGAVLGTITGTGNTVAFMDIAALTGDANANLYALRVGNLTGTTGADSEVEHAVSIGTGWDRGISTGSPLYVGDGTNGTTIGATGNVSFAGTATFSASSATSSVPWVVGTGTAANIVEGTAYWESDTDILTIGDAATGISLDFTAAAVYTFPAATSTLARTDAGQTFTGVQAFTAPTVATSITPNTFANASLGTGLLPFSSVFIGDAATNNVQLVNTAAASAVVLTLPSTTGTLALIDGSNMALASQATGDIIYAASSSTLGRVAAGATTEILVGGGAAVPVWTTATGTGAPVRANTPTLITPVIGAATGTSLIATGVVDGLTNVTLTTDGSEDANVSGKMSHVIINKHTTEATAFAVTLPATAIAGMQLLVKNGYGDTGPTTGVITVYVPATHYAWNPTTKTQCAQGYDLVSGGAAGDFIGMVAIAADTWESIGFQGTWTCTVTP